MLVSISYKEIVDFIEENYGIKLGIEKIDSKTIKLSGKLALLLPTVNIELSIERTNDVSIFVHYNSTAMNVFLKLIYSSNLNKISNYIDIDTKNKYIIIDRMIVTKDFRLEISSIEFDETAIKISATNFALV